MKLFAICVGGQHPRANIELHDIRFVAAETVEAAVPQLRAAWWGTPSSLHIDGYAELTHVDSRPITLVPGPAPPGPVEALWFINVGGYTPDLFGEQHNYLFMAGSDKAEIWARARSVSPDWTSRHKDNFVTVDDIIDVSSLVGATGWHVRVGDPEPGAPGPRLVSDYIRL